jgi:AraC-like DNA-binding protein
MYNETHQREVRAMTYMDIPYKLEEVKPEAPSCRFISIWKVQANDSYQVNKAGGFDSPGLFITYEGKGILTQGTMRHELRAGTYFFVHKEIPTAYRCLNHDWKFYFIDFNSLDMVHSLQLPAHEPVSSAKIAEALLLCEQIIDTLIAQPAGYTYSAHLRLQEILLLFARERTVTAMPRHAELNNILIYMHKHIDKPLRIEELIRQSGLSRTSFFTRFRAATGQSPSDYLLRLKLESAKVSLETTSLTVKEIAAKLQFYDEFHFSKLFKKHCGVSPSTYRRSIN